MINEKQILMASSILLALVFTPILAHTAFGNPYFGAYPDVSKRSATYVYTTCDFGGTTSSITNDVYCITSSSGQTSGGSNTPYMYQNFVEYLDSDNKLYFNSEVWNIDTSGVVHQPYDCESTGCTTLGNASDINYVKALHYWISGKVRFYAEKYPNVGSAVGYFNTDYTPGSDDTSAKFASGSETLSSKKLKYTQWSIEGPASASNWNIEQKEMSTWYPSTSSPFSSDTAKTTESSSDATKSSWIIQRVVSGTTVTAKVGDTSYCVHRSNNVAGDIQWVNGGTCLTAGTQLWP